MIVIRPGFEPMATAYRASTVPTELPSHLVDPALLDSSSNPLGTRHVVFDACSPSRQPTMSHQMSRRGGGGGGGGGGSWSDRDSNLGPLAIRETSEVLSHMVDL